MANAKIASQFVWNAQRLYRYSDQTKSFVQFYDEPWMADRFWEIQVNFMLTYMERTHTQGSPPKFSVNADASLKFVICGHASVSWKGAMNTL